MNLPTALAKRRPGIAAGASSRFVEGAALAAVLAVNWLAASQVPSSLFSWTSMALFVWLMSMVVRLSPRAAILMAPVAITRLATMLSLVAIEAGAYMPEVNRSGAPGDASASFVFFTAIFFLIFVAVFACFEKRLTQCARSRLLEVAVRLLAWPVVIMCAGWGALAFLHGLRSGFPLVEGVDRFLYRRYYSSGAVLMLLDNKFLLSALLGTIVFSPARSRFVRMAATATFLGLTGVYFLFGDKFFTILTEVSFFLMPYLLPRSERLMPLLLRIAPVGLALVALSGGMTLYIYSDYGRLPTDRAVQLVGERIAGQGELWYVATRDFRQTTNWDAALAGRYMAVLPDAEPPAAAFRNGVETYFFLQRYAPAKLAAAFRKSQGWVQLTMGTEAMALVMFGYVGVAVVMGVAALLLGLAAVYLERAFMSGFPLSLFFAVWTYLQVYFTVQQASLWTVAAPGQIKRFLLFFVIELALFAINRAEPLALRRRRAAAMRFQATPLPGARP